MRAGRRLGLVAAAMLLVSCSGNRAKIVISVPAMSGEEVVLSQLDVNRNTVLDTIVCDDKGHAVAKVKVPEDDPDFFYLTGRNGKLASLILAGGDKVKVSSSADGTIGVSGSAESGLMMKADSMYASVTERMDVLSDRLVANYTDVAKADALRKEMGKLFVEYYRDAVSFVMSHPSSLASVSVLFQVIGDNLRVFATDTDVAHYRNVRDSLSLRYPDSRYLKSLDSEISAREGALQMRIMMENASQVGYPDLILPDTQARKVQLSSVDKKVVLVHFWTVSDAAQKMYNQDVLKPLYEKYSRKGLEIYQISFDMDKAAWAGVVRSQGLEWINVNDYVGTSATYYAVSSLPYTVVIADGVIADKGVYTYKYLDNLVGRYLK